MNYLAAALEIPGELITGVATVLIAAVLCWVGTLIWGQFKKFQAHIDECTIRHQTSAVLTSKVETLKEEFKEMKKEMRWNGDCMITLGTSLKVNLPERPQ